MSEHAKSVLHEQAMASWEAGRRDEALGLLREAVHATVDLELLNDLAVATSEVVGAPAAAAVLQTVLAIDPSRTDARENLAALAPAEPAAAGDDRCGIPALLAGSLGPALSPKLLGHLLSTPRPGQEALAARLDEIPSATTPGERWLYHNLAAHLWSGERDIFENGPLMGGTTRAACLGMLANPRRRPEALLHTHDWFNSAIGLDVDDASLERLVARGALRRETLEGMWASGDFQAVFEELHAGQDYSPLLATHRAALPGFRHEEDTLADLFEVPADARYEVVFVDGCKSWYGTRFFLERIRHALAPGAYVVMQDFGWYTCFWLSSLIGLLPEHFRLVAYVDHTYAFELRRPIGEADLARFPDQPQDLGGGAFDDVYAGLRAAAMERDDSWALLSLTLQHAAALAYCGYREEARSRIAPLLDRPEYARQRWMIAQALRSPTYFPHEPLRI